VPANKAWFLALITKVRITALMNDPTTFAPAIWKTSINSEVEECLVERLG
jgi:hypothetical protein